MSCSPNNVDGLVIQEIWDNGVLPVFAAGNGVQCGGPANYLYPQAYGNSVVVTSVGHTDEYDIQYTGSQNVRKKDVHQFYDGANSGNMITHHHYDKVDISAPGYGVVIGVGTNSYFASYGTSNAAPIVSGAAALVFSLNPNLSPTQVENILKSTADNIYWIPENAPYQGLLGTGRLNAFRAVKETKCMTETNPVVNFMIKDSKQDIGDEPNNNTQYMWTSSDIFVRNQNDGKLVPVHQNPTYDGINPNYIYVRVTNIGCQTSSGNDSVSINWAKAGTSLNYPEYWDGTIIQNGVVFGGSVGSGVIPILKPGQEALVEIPWNIPNPQNYAQINPEPWHFCLLTRIISNVDTMTFPETWDVNTNTRNNNNIAWKNVTVVDVLPNNVVNPGGVVAVGNPFNHNHNFFLELEVADLETGKPIYQEAEVGIKMDDVLFNAWERGGKEAQLLDPTTEEKRKIVKGNNVIVDNISFNANEIGTLRLDFNFLTKELTDKTNYAYHVIQKDAETGQVIGGETFIINKNPRPVFEAEAPDKEVDLNQAITISAEDINEPAIYNWYDNAGNLIYQGKDLQVANAVAEKFKLEVIATSDGFKDYKEVEVTLKPSTLENIAPNPATNNVLVSYKINGASSAYLMVIGYYGSNGTSNNYILDTNSSETNLNVSNYASGFYTVALVVNGVIVDAKTLIKQ